MTTEIGEFVVGAYLRLCEQCDVVDYNARSPQKGIQGMTEIDVIGLRFVDQTAFLCEVATHLDGLNYGSYAETVSRIRSKYDRQRAYATENLQSFATQRFMLWAPRVPTGALTEFLAELQGLELVINSDYTSRIEKLRSLAKATTKDIGNPFFRMLQLLEHLRQ
jgi:hypothetical protein